MPTKQPKQQQLYLQVIDPYHLLPPNLRSAINTCPEWKVIDHTSSHPPTFLLLVTGENEQPSATIRRFLTTVPMLPAIVYDTVPTMSRQSTLFNVGGNGYVTPDVTLDELVPMLHLARVGGYSVSAGAMEVMRAHSMAPNQFSPREHQVVARIALGASPEAVAAELDLPLTTVQETLMRACRKAGVESVPALATWWGRWTMIDDATDDEIDDPTAYAITA